MDIFYCEKKEKCKWKAFALEFHGVGFGKIENTTYEWRQWHEKECGGKLIQAEIIETEAK